MELSSEQRVNVVIQNAQQFVFGQDDLLNGILAALICEGHLLIEGVPGLGKTLSVSVMSKLCELNFKRLQFTPDLLPSDLIGTMIFSQKSEEFQTKFGPIFTQILLADEINRAPAKVQSALLEAMAERQVTIGDQTYKLSDPFVVLATQNPIDQEGTYMLPEAQMDRFMMKIKVDYPDFESERRILETENPHSKEIEPIFSSDDILEIKEKIQNIYVDEKIKDLIVKIVHGTRPQSKLFPKRFEGIVMSGASPRASIWLYRLAKFHAWREGKDFVNPEHILHYIPSVLGHRITLSYEAAVDNLNGRAIALEMAKTIME